MNLNYKLRTIELRFKKGGLMAEKELGKITHFFDKISVAVVDLSGNLSLGEKIHVKGHTTDFVQDIDSMQLDKTAVNKASAGQVIGLKLNKLVREGDRVYKVE